MLLVQCLYKQYRNLTYLLNGHWHNLQVLSYNTVTVKKQPLELLHNKWYFASKKLHTKLEMNSPTCVIAHFWLSIKDFLRRDLSHGNVIDRRPIKMFAWIWIKAWLPSLYQRFYQRFGNLPLQRIPSYTLHAKFWWCVGVWSRYLLRFDKETDFVCHFYYYFICRNNFVLNKNWKWKKSEGCQECAIWRGISSFYVVISQC